jgi:hypothetical protein
LSSVFRKTGDRVASRNPRVIAEMAAPVPGVLVTSFAKDFLEKYAEANNKPSEVASKRMICNLHLVPALGSLRLDEVGPAQIEGYKASKLKALSPKTVNNHLIVLRRMLGVAVEWGIAGETFVASGRQQVSEEWRATLPRPPAKNVGGGEDEDEETAGDSVALPPGVKEGDRHVPVHRRQDARDPPRPHQTARAFARPPS